MKKIIILVIFVFTLSLLGCNSSSQFIFNDVNKVEYPSSNEFWNKTEIEEFLLDAEFIDIEAADEFINEYKTNDMAYYSVDDFDNLSTTLDELSLLTINRSSMAEIDNFENEKCRYIVIPLFSTWVFDDYNLDSSYEDGSIVFSLSTISSNFPMSMVKVLILRINSEYLYDILINPQQ